MTKAASAPWTCPRCRGGLAAGVESLRCVPCDTRYPIVAGIPDLRVQEGPFISNAADREKARYLAGLSGRTFDQLVDEYYAITPEVPPSDAARFGAGIAAGRERARAWLSRWEADGSGKVHTVLVDVGCGTAPLLHAGAGRYDGLVGVDIALRWLVVAARGLQEAGIEAHLACACAEALPLPEGFATRVVFLSSLEHVADQAATLAEAHRVLAPTGTVHVVTPNRWSVGPDPHLGIWGGSLLPQALVRRVALARRALPPVRHLLSSSRLGALLRRAGYGDIVVRSPRHLREVLGRGSAPMATALAVYEGLRRLPLLGLPLSGVGPLLEARARAGAGHIAEATHG